MIEIHRTDNEFGKVEMEMTDNGKRIGYALAYIKDGAAELENIECDIPVFLNDMGKAILNAIDLMEIKTVICKNTELEGVLKALRFKLDDGVYTLDLSGYFGV